MSRESFLARVKAAAAAGRMHPVHVRTSFPPRVGYCGAGDDPIGRLVAEVGLAGGQAQRVADLAAARLALGEILEKANAKSALTWQHPLLTRLGLAELLDEKGVTRLDHASLARLEPAQRLQDMLAADVGISSVDYAVAETGTLALSSGPGQERAASLLPPIHVAIVEESQVLPDLFDLFDRMEAQMRSAGENRLASGWVLITGPSKTGDLELKLTTGVHGPGTWHVIVVG